MIQEDELKFPVLCIKSATGEGLRYREGWSAVIENWDILIIRTTTGLKKGFYNDMLIIDSDGKAVKIIRAHELHPVGPWGGYDQWLHRYIKVSLEPDCEYFRPTVDQVKDYVFKFFEECHLWSSVFEFEDAEEKVKNASSIREIIDSLRTIGSINISG
jgi:hypothetical protein